MRSTMKTLLFTCAVCAVAQGNDARAQPAPDPSQPAPSPTVPSPTIPSPNSPTTPSTPSPSTSSPTTPDPSTHNPGDPALNNPPITTPDTTAGTTTTTTTTTTTVAPVVPVTPLDTDVGAPDSGMYRYGWTDENLESGIGVSAILGGGVLGFTDQTMRNTTSDVGGLWDLRVTIGSHIPLALDVSYLGSAMNINGLPTGQRGTLIGTTVEGALRFNMLPHNSVNPYVFAGAGWQRYDVTNTNVTLSDSGMNDTDNLVEFPMGGGLSFRSSGFVADLRGTFRATTEQDLVLRSNVLPPASPTSDDFAPMHTWEASAAIGYEF